MQLRLEETEQNGYKRFTLLYHDPKEEESETTDDDNKSADTGTPENK